MLSIIIASHNPTQLKQLKANIAATAGIQFELIVLENAAVWGLCHIYNVGGEKAAYPYLLFLHEDVLIHTNNWGQKLLQHLQNPYYGVIGIMGSRYKSAYGISWRDGETEQFRMQVKDGVERGKLLIQRSNKEEKSEVISIDGVFLACRKEVWQQHPFDAQTFTGFHFYDLDFCMQVGKNFPNYIVYDILVEHFSQGTICMRCVYDFQKFRNKWKQELPKSIENIPPKKIAQWEGYAVAITLSYMKDLRFSFAARISFLQQYWRQYHNFYQYIRSFYFGFLKP